jgi:uncharacterized protein (DUF2249 family)
MSSLHMPKPPKPSDRISDPQVGLEVESGPKVWRVYKRKRGKRIKGADVDGVMHGMHDSLGYM